MRRAILFGATCATLVLFAVCLAGRGDARKKDLSSTRWVTIDGESFVREESSMEEPALILREIAKRNVRLPDGFDLRNLHSPPNAVYSGRVVDSPRPISAAAVRLPAGLAGEHTIRMEGEGEPLELVFGRTAGKGPAVRNRLLASGWESLPVFDAANPLHVLQKTSGKETTVVCLDEKEGEFLLFREVGR